MDVLLATCAAMPGLYVDDRYVLEALTRRGHVAAPAVWEDPHAPWEECGLCLIRSTWDYSYRRDQYLVWTERVGRATRLWNPVPVVRWNTHKRYLSDLAAHDVATVPTLLLSAGSDVGLEELLLEHGWEDVVIKAAVAQTGRHAVRVGAGEVDRGQAHLGRLLPHEDMLVQPWVPAAVGGETSLVFIDGEFTHAVKKQAAGGEFLVHHDYGGSVRPTRPQPAQFELAERALARVREPLLYARVDLVADEHGNPMVMELELVEPELYFRYSQAAVERLVNAVERELGGAR
jgi:glutathione synthase/RimK-type ligase-like ATP-grasp enzyme